MNKRKNLILVVAVIVIIGAIVLIEHKKPERIDSSTVSDVSVPLGTADTAASVDRSSVLAAKAKQYTKAKEFVNPSGFINTAPFTLSSLLAEHKVVLIDFWTYSCINCQRTIPYLNAWYQKYKDAGLVIVGIHTPEFDFEKDKSNVAAAVQKAGIEYPVVMDNEMRTWSAYNNQYWPREYLIDVDGYVVHNHIGEGGYAETEQAIQSALKERNELLGSTDAVPVGTVDPSNAVDLNENAIQSQETYFGAERNGYLGNGTKGKIMTQTLTIPQQDITANTLYLDGTWNIQYQYAESVSHVAHIVYQYNAKHVYMVASAKDPVTLKVTVDGKSYKEVTVQAHQLYDLVDGTDYGAHTLQIEVEGAGLDAYTFTFG